MLYPAELPVPVHPAYIVSRSMLTLTAAAQVIVETHKLLSTAADRFIFLRDRFGTCTETSHC